MDCLAQGRADGMSFASHLVILVVFFAFLVISRNMVMRELAPQLHIPWSIPMEAEDIPIVPTTSGTMYVLKDEIFPNGVLRKYVVEQATFFFLFFLVIKGHVKICT